MKKTRIFRVLSIAALLLHGAGVAADYEQAMTDYQAGNYDDAFRGMAQEAETDNGAAQIKLAEMFMAGQGTERDIEQAHMWMTIAYLTGESDVRDRLAEMRTEMSEGQVSRSERLAIEWVEGGVSPMHEFWANDDEEESR